MKIQGKRALVTGGASGLGAATVRMLAERGAKVLIADVNEKSGQELAQELGNAVAFVKTDVTNPGQVRAAMAEAAAKLGGLHILVTTAGIGVAEKLLGKNGLHDLDKFVRVLQVNLIGTFDAIRHAAELMSHNQLDDDGGRGVIITTASVAAYEGQIGQTAYSASKGGIVGMNTPLLGTLPEAALASLSEQVPFPKRLGQPAEYAALDGHIIENNMINGETIRIDGAIRMAAK